ncbi:MAG: type I restriction-modification system subunit M N-terminal domain-containing protein [Methylococcales bacterium]
MVLNLAKVKNASCKLATAILRNKIVSFIWSIADDCLRDVFVRGKYRDVILPMFVLRRLDALLEPTKDAVAEEQRFQIEEAGFIELEPAGLYEASGFVLQQAEFFDTLKTRQYSGFTDLNPVSFTDLKLVRFNP